MAGFALVAAVLAGAGPFAPSAEAAFPGANGKIAFSSGGDIWVMDADGTNQTQLTSHPDWDDLPAWSPDGSHLVFRSTRDDMNGEIYVMDEDGGNQTRLTFHPATDYFPAWSGDGTQIAFTSHRDGNAEIYVMDADGSNLLRLTNNLIQDERPQWSADGSKIAFTSGSDVVVMDANGSNPTNLTTPDGGWAPAWSPDGSKIAFVSYRTGGRTEIFVMDADGSNPTRLTFSIGDIWYPPAWSPDGTMLAFSFEPDPGSPEIWTMDANGLNLTQLTSHDIREAYGPDWQPLNRPETNDDFYVVMNSGTLAEPAPGILGNDSDPNGDPFTATALTDPSHGTLDYLADGSFTYVHDGSATSSDSFTYRASDGTWISDETTVWIFVSDPPVAVNDGPYVVDVGDTLELDPPGVLMNDTDPDGDALTAPWYTDPDHGTLEFFIDGSFTYSHDGSGGTDDSFTYWAWDGWWDSNEATVSITVNHPPVAIADGPYPVNEDSTLSVATTNGMLDNDTDPNMDALTAVKVTDPSHGNLSLNADGSFTYSPEPGFNGTDAFTYRANDGRLNSNIETVSISVDPVDDVGTSESLINEVAAGETATTDEAGDGATAADPVETSVTSPVAGLVTIEEGPATATDPSGYQLLDVQVQVTAPAATASDPLQLIFRLDASMIPTGEDVTTIELFKDGALVAACAGSGSASPDPCVSSRKTLSDGDAEIAVLTSAASLWGFGTHSLQPTSVGLVDPSQGKWYLRDYDTGAVASFFYGNPGDIPFLGDWDCNGEATPGLFRQSDAYAYLRNSNTVGIADIRFYFGNPSDVPLAGDFNGDGCDTLSIYRPSEQRFYIMNELGKNEGGLGAAEYAFTFGNPGDKPVVGDWDGDGIDEIGLHRESTGFFYYRNTLDVGIADDQFYFGDPGDRFAAGDWGTIDGVETPAVFRPANTTFYFRWTNTPGTADSEFVWGESGWLPVSGVLD